MGKRSISTMLIVMLMISLMPPLVQKAHAAVNMVITQPSAASTSQSNPMNVTSQNINIEFQYTDIADSDLPNVFYEVNNLTTGTTIQVKDNPPVKLGSLRAIFQNVQLTEGLNSFTVILDSPSKPRSLSLWLNYTAVTTISNLKINNKSFINGIFVPDSNTGGTTSIFVDGTAPNAAEVMGYSTLTPGGKRSDFFQSSTGQFSFSTGEAASSDLRLRPGDNDMTIIASNPFKSYRSERTLVYNNGMGFLYNTEIVATDNITVPVNGEEMLYKQPTLESTGATGPYTIELETDVKVNRDVAGMTHNGFSMQINGGVVINATFSGLGTNSVDVTIPTNTVTTAVYHTVEVHPDYYLIKSVNIENIPIDITQTNQVANITFNPVGSYDEETQAFSYFFINQFQPFVDKVLMDNGQELYSGIEISITTSSFELLVDTKNNVDRVNVYLPEDSTSTPIATTNTFTVPSTGVKRFTVTLDKNLIPEGLSILRFVPELASVEYPIGAKEFSVNYNPSPYVYLTNVYNGQIFSEASTEPKLNINGVSSNGPVLQMIPVNIPTNQLGDIRVRLNDKSDKVRTVNTGFGTRPTYSGQTLSGDVLTNTSTGKLVELRFQFGPNTHTNRSSWTLLEGLNTLIMEVYAPNSLDANGSPLNNAEPITTFKYELFYFTDDLPQVTVLDLEPTFALNNNYTQVAGEDFRYYTQESKLKFTTSFVEADNVRIKVTTLKADGTQNVRTGELQWNGTAFAETGGSSPGIIASTINVSSSSATNNGNGTVISQSIDLVGSGTNTVEVTVTNSAGNISTRIMEIVREPALFVMHYPRIDQNPVTEEWVGRINGNYTRIYLEAEGADKIIYGKSEEVSQTTVIALSGINHDLYVFEVKGLKKGSNKVEFTVVRGTREDNITVTLINADTAVPGAEFKESIAKSSIKAFNNQFLLKFPKGTVLMRNNPSAVDQYLAPTRDLLIGIADPQDGRVNKYLHPVSTENSIFPRNPQWESNFARVQSPAQRFRKVSPLYWIDGGYIPLNGTDPSQSDILSGSGIYPYELSKEFYMRNATNVNDQFIASQAGELTLSYNPNMVSSSWRYISVYHYGYNENYMGLKLYEWKNIGGTVDSKKNTITVPIQEFGYYVVMYMDQSFDDIIGHPWARNYLDTLYSRGMMMNKEGQRFETNEAITRGEFASLLVKAYDLPLDYEGTGTFSDVSRANPLSMGLYEYKYIETAARAGIIRGSLQKRFLPGNTITREEAAAMIARAGNFKLDTNEAKVKTALEKEFTDVANFESYAMPSALVVAKAKLMEGKPSITNTSAKPTFYFDPKANMTRAEAATVMMKVLMREKKIPSL